MPPHSSNKDGFANTKGFPCGKRIEGQYKNFFKKSKNSKKYEEQKELTPLHRVRSLKDVPLEFVGTEKLLNRLIQILNNVTEFAVDLEYSPYNVWLIQISTRTVDYIIDPIPLRSQIRTLNEPFENPNIVKVFHGGDNDIKWLSQAFEIRVSNMFDTWKASEILKLQKHSYIGIVEKFCDVVLSKSCQRSDWKRRPLSSQQIMYARCDTHFLLQCYDELLKRVQEEGKIQDMQEFSVKICGRY
uniref:3'-5' exonuclease domain-containing protein n=1 Tax=Acrobeloides nanus TaxID=290746 RepID=A0A914EAV3_9BILA